MHKRHLSKPLKASLPGTEAGVPPLNERNSNLLLLISDNLTLGKSLRDAAEQQGLLFARSSAGSNLLWQLRALRPGTVLLDLDLPSQAVLETTGCLLDLDCCPPLFVLTGRRNQRDAATSVRGGPTVDKPPGAVRLLQPPLGERNPIKRIHIQWLGPCGWPVRITSSNGPCDASPNLR